MSGIIFMHPWLKYERQVIMDFTNMTKWLLYFYNDIRTVQVLNLVTGCTSSQPSHTAIDISGGQYLELKVLNPIVGV